MKILHLADLHLGRSQVRDEVTLNCIDRAFDEADKRKVDIIVIAGDVYDRAIINVSGAPLENLLRLFLKVGHHIPIIIIRGTPTHDVAGSLDIFKPLQNVSVIETWNYMRIIQGYDVLFFCLPEPSKAVLAASGVESEIINQKFNEAFRLSLMAFKAKSQEYPPTDIPRILLSHINITGAQTAGGYSPDSSITAGDLLQLSGADAVMLGHIHKAQTFVNGRVRYSGSVSHLDYGETEPEKGCWLWEFDKREIVDVEWIPLPSRRLVTYEITGIDDAGRIDFDEPTADPAGMEVKLRIPSQYRESNSVKSFLNKNFKDVHSLKIEWLPEKKQIRLRSENIIKTKSLSEEVQEWGEVAGEKITDSVLKKVEKIETEEFIIEA